MPSTRRCNSESAATPSSLASTAPSRAVSSAAAVAVCQLRRSLATGGSCGVNELTRKMTPIIGNTARPNMASQRRTRIRLTLPKRERERREVEGRCKRIVPAGAGPTIQYRRIRGGKSLSSQNLTILRELATWREYEGRKENRPVSWLVKDKTLVNIAKYKPESRDKLEQISRQSGENVNSYAESLLKAVVKGMNCPTDQLAINLNQKFNHRQNFKIEVEGMLEKIREKSKQYGIDSNLVASKVEVEAFLKNAATAPLHCPRLLCNWRKEFLT